ncbi:hypothetical protein X943_000454 [Babesia divergens]|uniref:Uncharacterized protein n=1 Tax=Babesia divergens TaxID=32595 RepID=A0AAD9G6G2_BABDI|nr:hypothetical protein X943_000454 [Babesia divergens]
MDVLRILNVMGLCSLAFLFNGKEVSCGIFGMKTASKKSSKKVEEPAPLKLLQKDFVDSNLASAILFLEEFCFKVTTTIFKDKLKDERFKGIKNVCTRIHLNAHYLTRSLLFPVEGEFLGRNLQAEKFDDYTSWLGKNLPGIIKALQNMADGILPLTKEKLTDASANGLASYGFSYKKGTWRDMVFKSDLKSVNRILQKDFSRLHSYFGKSTPVVENSLNSEGSTEGNQNRHGFSSNSGSLEDAPSPSNDESI